MPVTTPRVETCPPRAAGSALEAFWRWIDTGWSRRPLNRAARHSLRRVGPDFLDSVADLSGPRCAELQRRIRSAQSLHDLWHLRADIFALVSHEHDQAQAQERLARLNRHFPTRASRSGFAPLDPKDRGG
jgi:hypothetical protein